MAGQFTLQTARDLLAKLEYDLLRIEKDQQDPYCAYDFFIAAEHIPEWTQPPCADLRKSEPLLRVVSHLANGSKHFVVDPKRHKSVRNTGAQGSYFPKDYFPPDYFAVGYFGASGLTVDLASDEATALGTAESISVLDLARRVVTFWRAKVI